MHDLAVIVARNTRQAAREHAHADNDGASILTTVVHRCNLDDETWRQYLIGWRRGKDDK